MAPQNLYVCRNWYRLYFLVLGLRAAGLDSIYSDILHPTSHFASRIRHSFGIPVLYIDEGATPSAAEE